MVIVHKFDRFARNRFDSIFYKNLLADMLFDERRIPGVIEEYNRRISEHSSESEKELKAMRKIISEELSELKNKLAEMERSSADVLSGVSRLF